MKTNKQVVTSCAGLFGLLAGLAITTLPAPAQFGSSPYNGIRTDRNRTDRNRTDRNRTEQNRSGQGAIQLPEGVDNVTSIDAINTLIAEMSDPATGENKEYAALSIRHVYSGGIARVLGGLSVPTEEFISPGFGEGNAYGNSSFGNTGTGVLPNGGGFSSGGFGQGFGNNQNGFGGIVNGMNNFGGANNFGNQNFATPNPVRPNQQIFNRTIQPTP